MPYVTSCAHSYRFPHLTLRHCLEAEKQRNLHTSCLSPTTWYSGKAARNANRLCWRVQEQVPVPQSHQAVLATQSRRYPSQAGRHRWEEMGAPQPPSSEEVDKTRGSPWKAAEHAGGRRQVPGSAHPILQPAGSTTCSPDPAQLLLALLLCSVFFFICQSFSQLCTQ